jgi:hypothetical protein
MYIGSIFTHEYAHTQQYSGQQAARYFMNVVSAWGLFGALPRYTNLTEIEASGYQFDMLNALSENVACCAKQLGIPPAVLRDALGSVRNTFRNEREGNFHGWLW